MTLIEYGGHGTSCCFKDVLVEEGSHWYGGDSVHLVLFRFHALSLAWSPIRIVRYDHLTRWLFKSASKSGPLTFVVLCFEPARTFFASILVVNNAANNINFMIKRKRFLYNVLNFNTF